MELPSIQEMNSSTLVGTGGKNSYLILVNSSNLFCFLFVQKIIYLVCVCAICYPKIVILMSALTSLSMYETILSKIQFWMWLVWFCIQSLLNVKHSTRIITFNHFTHTLLLNIKEIQNVKSNNDQLSIIWFLVSQTFSISFSHTNLCADTSKLQKEIFQSGRSSRFSHSWRYISAKTNPRQKVKITAVYLLWSVISKLSSVRRN